MPMGQPKQDTVFFTFLPSFLIRISFVFPSLFVPVSSPVIEGGKRRKGEERCGYLRRKYGNGVG